MQDVTVNIHIAELVKSLLFEVILTQFLRASGRASEEVQLPHPDKRSYK